MQKNRSKFKKRVHRNGGTHTHDIVWMLNAKPCKVYYQDQPRAHGMITASFIPVRTCMAAEVNPCIVMLYALIWYISGNHNL